jgi:hypothetical protein
MRTLELDSISLYNAFVSGGKELIAKREEINKINVFPVADGDTGTNLAMTMSSLIERSSPMTTEGETMRSMAEAALSGARGNSGIIFAQFFVGLSEAIGEIATVTIEAFAHAVKNAAKRAREAVLVPIEGTMLTVIHNWVKEFESHKHLGDFGLIFQRTLAGTKRSVDNTPNLLPVLKTEHVVDAGAEGFFRFISGATKYLSSESREAAAAIASEPEVGLVDLPPAVHGGEYPVFRYCVEVFLRGDNMRLDDIRQELGSMGDSGIVAGSPQKARVHVHTDDPAGAVRKLSAYGIVQEQKVDDMLREYEVTHARKYPIALVTDSVCDLPKAIIDRYQIHVVPLSILMGGSQYLDGLTVSNEDIYRGMEAAGPYPTSSQPSPAAFRLLYSFLTTYYESVIAIHVSSKLSGTFALSAKEAARFPDKRITVIDSRNNSGSQALIVLRAAELIAAGKSHEEVVQEVRLFIPKARIFVAVPTLKYMVKGGRVSPLKGAVAGLLNLKPVVSLDEEGGSKLYGKAFSVGGTLKRIIALTREFIGGDELRCYAVVHTGNVAAAGAFADRLTQAVGKKPLFIQEISSIIALNAGKNTLAVVLMKE